MSPSAATWPSRSSAAACDGETARATGTCCVTSPTWLDYVRHNQRRTRADAAISDQLHALHRGDSAPVATRMLERDIGATLGNHLHGILPGPRQVHW